MDDILENVRNEETGFAGIFDLRKTPLLCTNMVRQYCESNSCGKYNANWTCPPAVGPADECIKKIERYSKALVFRSDYKLNEWYDYERLEETIRMHQANVRRVRDLIPKDIGDHLVLSGGGCVYCKECAFVENKECRHPDLAIPPVEALCIDIYRFTKKNGIVYGAPEGEMYYFGMVLYDPQ